MNGVRNGSVTLVHDDGKSWRFSAVDVGFLSDMQTHHGGAISMSFDYLAHENDSLVGHFAREIFMHLMIRHHAAGAAMAEYAAAHGENDGVKQLAAAMARVQRTEVAEMNSRRKALGLAPVSADELQQLERGMTH